MNRIPALLTLCALTVVAAAGAAPADQAMAPARMNLKVLFVGGSGEQDATMDKSLQGAGAHSRMTAFGNLLRRYFTDVTVMHARDYHQDKSAGYDVTVMDGTPEPIEPRREVRDDTGRITEIIAARYFTEDFDRPVLLIAELGDRLGRRVGVKFDWYCLCLDAHAHSLRTDHPIFHGPFPVKLTMEERPTPEAAFHYEYFRHSPTPKTLPMWRVQTRGYQSDPGFRIGMVARPWGFEDSPDAEYISSGVCAKGLDAVALGRHGNFFGWGFAASPDYMTDEAKTVFANAVAYISKFDGQGLIARKYHDRRATKEWIRELKYGATREAWQTRNEMNRAFAERMTAERQAAQAKQARGESLTAEEQRALGFKPQPEQTFETYLREGSNRDLFGRFGTDSAAYQRYYDENYDYFYSVAPFYKLVVDEDVKSLGIANTDPRVLDRAIELWEQGKDVAMAQRILTRYTLLDYQTPREWRQWFEDNRSRLFFTQTGGFVFMVDSRDPQVQGNSYARDGDFPVAAAPANSSAAIEPGETDDLNPVSIAAGVSDVAGDQVLVVKFRIHPGYHIYSHVAPEDPFIATKLAFELPDGYRRVGELQSPPYEPYNKAGSTGMYTGEVVYRQKITGSGAGVARLAVTYQTCDARICLPPATVEFKVALN